MAVTRPWTSILTGVYGILECLFRHTTVLATREVRNVGTTKKTLIVFSDDFDKVLAAFVIANGAAAMGDDVTMFFTFWGLNVLRKPAAEPHEKSMLQGMLSQMMPKGPGELTLSKAGFGNMGAEMMRNVMREENVSSLEELVETAKEQGIKMIACKMSMDLLGLHEDELVDGLEFVGVASYLAEADEASVNLFI